MERRFPNCRETIGPQIIMAVRKPPGRGMEEGRDRISPIAAAAVSENLVHLDQCLAGPAVYARNHRRIAHTGSQRNEQSGVSAAGRK